MKFLLLASFHPTLLMLSHEFKILRTITWSQSAPDTRCVCQGVVFSPCSGVLETHGAPCTLSQWKSLSKLGPVDSGLLIGFVLSSPSSRAGFEGTSEGKSPG